MIKSFGHQTVKKTAETVNERIKKGPIKSTVLDKDGKQKRTPPFAGDGHYFWEDNIEAAEWWGEVHCNNKYRVFRVNLDLRYDDSSLLDLVGSRQHLKFVGNLIRKTKMGTNCDGWKFHNYVAYWRLQESRKKGMFPYKLIRFNDSSLNPKIQTPLALSDYQHRVFLNPFYIVCVFEKENIHLDTFIFVK